MMYHNKALSVVVRTTFEKFGNNFNFSVSKIFDVGSNFEREKRSSYVGYL